MKIYVASSWRNSMVGDVVALLRREGHDVYDFRHPKGVGSYGFLWSDVDPNWEQWDTKDFTRALLHPIAQRGFDSDFTAMKEADACVLVLPCGRSAHTEAGYMAGCGKPVYVFSPDKQEPELMYKIYSLVTDQISDIINKLTIAEQSFRNE